MCCAHASSRMESQGTIDEFKKDRKHVLEALSDHLNERYRVRF